MYSKYCGVVRGKDRRLPERRLDRRLRRPAGGARRAVQRQPDRQRTAPTPTGVWSTIRRSTQRWKRRRTVVGTKARGEAWAKIDRELVEEAVAIPFQWAKEPNIEAKDVDGVDQYVELGDLGLRVHVAEVSAARRLSGAGHAPALGAASRRVRSTLDRAAPGRNPAMSTTDDDPLHHPPAAVGRRCC